MSIMLIINLVLATFWLIMTADLSVSNGLFGFLIGGIILFLIRGHLAKTKYIRRIWLIFRLFLYFLYELILSSFRVLSIILTSPRNHKTVIMSYSSIVKSDFELVLLANIITLTPGTLSIDIDVTKNVIYIHVLDVLDINSLRASIRNGFERMIIDAFS